MNAISTTIIGGADGPTSIYLASTFNPFELILCVAGVIIVVAGFIVWRKIRKRRNCNKKAQ